jgi:hypothetical protein
MTLPSSMQAKLLHEALLVMGQGDLETLHVAGL